jgi:hypothetical protein
VDEPHIFGFTMPFELYLLKHHVFLQFRKPKKVPNFSNAAFQEKAWAIPHEKCHFWLEMNFLIKAITKIATNFT